MDVIGQPMKRDRAALPSVDLLEQCEQGLRLRIDSGLYTDEVVFRTCYSFTGRCTILLDRVDTNHVLAVFMSRDSQADLSSLVGEFANELISQRVRADIARETKTIRDLIVAQAFAEAALPADRSIVDPDQPAIS